MDSVYSKNDLAELLEKKRKKYLSNVDHSNGTDGCSCNIKLIYNYINNNYINNNYINTKYINNIYINNIYINNKYVDCCI